MKCKYCGASVTLEDEYCPYCGARNEAAGQHVKDMKRYGADYADTRAEVLSNAEAQSRRHSGVIAIVVLVLVNLILLVAHGKLWDIHYEWDKYQAKVHWDEHKAVLDQLEAEARYDEMYTYISGKELSGVAEELPYSTVALMGYHYGRVLEFVYYLDNEDARTFYSRDEILDRLTDNLAQFYKDYNNRERTYRTECYEEPHWSSMVDMNRKLQCVLADSCGLTAEDLKTLHEKSAQEMMVLIGRRMGYYE